MSEYKEINEALRLWAAEQGAAHFAHLKVGDYLAHAPRGGGPRALGRIDGFSLELRSGFAGGTANVLRPGASMRVEPALLVRLAARRFGGMLWSEACQYVGERALAREWRAADPAMVRDVLRQIEGAPERRLSSYSPYDAAMDMCDAEAELSPEKGR